MEVTYTVEILGFDTINTLPNGWNHQNFKELLDVLDFGDTASLQPSEMKEMAKLALTENEPNEAAKILLDYIFETRLNENQKYNLSHEMIAEKMWKEYPEIAIHEDFFNIGQLLYEAYNGKFPRAEAAQFRLKVSAKKNTDLAIFQTQTEANILRIVAQGMPPNTLLKRLFKDQLDGSEFEEAPHIIWQLKAEEKAEKSIIFNVISSLYWFQDLKFVNEFEADITLE
jgi:hypothetical protein